MFVLLSAGKEEGGRDSVIIVVVSGVQKPLLPPQSIITVQKYISTVHVSRLKWKGLLPGSGRLTGSAVPR
jgi:hypothetical protein